MDSKEILKKYCKQKYGNEIIIKTYDIQEVKQIIDFTKQLLIHSVVVSEACECDRPDPFKLMPYKCFRCHGKIEISEVKLVCEHCNSKNVTVGDGGLWCDDCGKLTKQTN